jgi:tetratricopeptide (TPR) repeat protein
MAPDSRRILILASSPEDQSRVLFDREAREIREGLQRSRLGSHFDLQERFAVRPNDLRRALLDVEPEIVHFCGHGAGEEGLLLEDDRGRTRPVATTALADLFSEFTGHVQCVVLNACFSEVQADAICIHIPYVIGMDRKIGNYAAIQFSVGFYDALGAGRPVESAYKLGRIGIAINGLPGDLAPLLKKGRSPVSDTSFEKIGSLSQQQLFRMIEHYKMLATLKATDGDAHYSLGLVYLHLQLHDLALQHFQRAIDLSPDKADAHYYYGVTLIRGRRPKTMSLQEVKAVERHVRAAIQLDRKPAKYYLLLGMVGQDYYLGNGLGAQKPSVQELLAEAQSRNSDLWEAERLIQAVPIGDQRLISALRPG